MTTQDLNQQRDMTYYPKPAMGHNPPLKLTVGHNDLRPKTAMMCDP